MSLRRISTGLDRGVEPGGGQYSNELKNGVPVLRRIYNPDTGNRLFTNNSIGSEFGLGSWGVVAAYDNGFLITSSSLFKTDSLGQF